MWALPPCQLVPNSAGADIEVKAPEDARVRFIIDSVACYVMVDGCSFEQALMSRESRNPEFLFLYDVKSAEHAYYRWRLYSLAQVRRTAEHFRRRRTRASSSRPFCRPHSTGANARKEQRVLLDRKGAALLLQGDSLRSWRNEPLVMVEGGPRWIPPSMTSLTNGRQQTAAQRGGEAREKDKPLSDLQRDRRATSFLLWMPLLVGLFCSQRGLPVACISG